MLRFRELKANEKGTTLTELLIYMVLLAVLLGGAYTIYEGSNAIYASTSDQADAQQSARLAQLIITRDLRMIESIVTADDYEIDFRADIDDDNVWEEVKYYLQNNHLYRAVDGGPAKDLAKGMQNLELNRPMFTYYDTAGATITDAGSRRTKSIKIQLDLRIDVDTNRPPGAYSLKTKVMLRNRD